MKPTLTLIILALLATGCGGESAPKPTKAQREHTLALKAVPADGRPKCSKWGVGNLAGTTANIYACEMDVDYDYGTFYIAVLHGETYDVTYELSGELSPERQ